MAHLARQAAELSQQDRDELVGSPNTCALGRARRGRSVAADYAGAVRSGTMAAARLHQRLGLRDHIEVRGGNVDIFRAIQMLDLPLLLRPLQGLLGAYLNEPSPGILVTTQRPMSIQRFTAAHELGHFSLHHRPSLDDETILRRMPMPEPPTGDFQEVEADVFAVMFMMPAGYRLARRAPALENPGFPKPERHLPALVTDGREL